MAQRAQAKKKKLLRGEKNFWRRKGIKNRNQSVSVAAMDDLDEDTTIQDRPDFLCTPQMQSNES